MTENRSPRALTLGGSSAFGAVLGNRCASNGDYLRVFAKQNTDGRARLGVTVSRKVCKLAVGRNYMKRVVRQLFRQNRESLQGLDVVVMHRKAFSPSEYPVLVSEFGVHARRVQRCRSASVPSFVPTSTS